MFTSLRGDGLAVKAISKNPEGPGSSPRLGSHMSLPTSGDDK